MYRETNAWKSYMMMVQESDELFYLNLSIFEFQYP